ncbi:MAG: hypothetical protein ACU0BC_11650 [Pseudooceanicola nanhaiensis]|uniref:hypothetical protein n=2 Tax=Pseudooceanicola nanhaiensis TaxID=375761 RepID=UPI004057E77F
MRSLIGLAALALLPACMRGDMTLDFESPEVVVARSAIDLTLPMLDAFGMGADGVCGAGKATETAQGVTCRSVKRNDVAEVIAGRVDFGGFGGEMDLTGIVTTERIRSDRIRVSVDVAALVDAVRAVDPAGYGAFLHEANDADVQGLILRVRGGEIVGTTGQLSEDGEEARIFIRASVFQTPDPDISGYFITLLTFPGDCLIDLFCD